VKGLFQQYPGIRHRHAKTIPWYLCGF